MDSMKNESTCGEQVSESEERLEYHRIVEMVGELIPFGIWVCAPDGGVRYLSPSYLDAMGVSLDECRDYDWLSHLAPDQIEPMLAAWAECRAEGDAWKWEHRMRAKSGDWVTVLSRGVPIRDARGEIFCWAGINLDITERKCMEERLRETSAQKELLLRESNHRVKNHLQMIASMVRLDARNQSPAVQAFAETTIQRLMVMSKLHDALSFADRGDAVDAGSYLAAICQGLSSSTVRVSALVDEAVWLASWQAAPFALIVNEAVSNAIQHGSSGAGGEVVVRLGMAGGAAKVEILDRGPGVGDGRNGSFGLSMMGNLAGQLGGTFVLSNRSDGGGAVATLLFPLTPPGSLAQS